MILHDETLIFKANLLTANKYYIDCIVVSIISIYEHL